MSFPDQVGLYDRRFEHDACGVGFAVNIDGRKDHEITTRGIRILENLIHRGASGDDETGDGAGILVQTPDDFFRPECSKIGIDLPPEGSYGTGMLFLPDDDTKQECRKLVEESIESEGLEFLGWRTVPIESSVLGGRAADEMPCVEQCFVGTGTVAPEELELQLYVARRVAERSVLKVLPEAAGFYIASLSSRTVLYKGMLMGTQLASFYPDLRDERFTSAIAVVHQRYSTNTFPSWKLAQPFRYLAHNGEINTLQGNINQMRSREALLASEQLGPGLKKLLPIIDETGSDSSCLDNALELLLAGGRSLPHAMMTLVPQAWGLKYPIGPDLRGFFEYHAGLVEPWDGPAALAVTDGRSVCALLDRNGLRPARYAIDDTGFMVLASEAGVLDLDQSKIVEKGALRPGQMLLVDLEEKRVVKDCEIKTRCARNQPYRRWVDENKIVLHGLFNDIAPVSPDTSRLLNNQKMFGYTREDLRLVLRPMASNGHEPVGSMGFDAPLAVLSEKPQPLYCYFKHRFAQITNPPIDPIREELVMSLMTFMGNPGNILSEDPRNSRLIKLKNPVLSNEDLERIKGLSLRHFTPHVLQIGFPANGGVHALEEAIEKLCNQAQSAALSRRALIILTDRDLPEHVAPIPALLAVSAVNKHLAKKGVRTESSIIVETGEAREVHHLAMLLGFGATAVNPYLAFDTIADLVMRDELDESLDVTRALENYIKALCKGLLKIMSKMGISTLRSYRSAQVYEALGVSTDLIERYFAGTPSRIEGIGLDDIYDEVLARYMQAREDSSASPAILPSGGRYRLRKDGERHLWTDEAITCLQQATRTNDRDLYERYAELINDQVVSQSTLRGLLKFKPGDPVPIEEVESAEAIMKRFAVSAMSFGSISREAHETIAVAMNRIGAMSNSGEGGEDPERYRQLPNGDSKCSMVKQVASGRFGVTTEYLVNCRELQIKIAQGAKPGEGGQLPGHKVNEEIARVRHSTPGVTLISPPPHHDIYSIEDIKQLIFDLKNVNPEARVSVKLVSEVGVGTVAAGVAKGHADMVLISGYDGGTGASPLSSIQHAGIPWELGLSETQQTLVLNNLRDRIRVQVDGQLKTGRDIVIATLLGAEEFGFATAPLVVSGCIMMRKCSENVCPVGIATQNPELRCRYAGKPEYLVNFFKMIAEDVRETMAMLGFRTVDEMVGRSDMLVTNEDITFKKARRVDLSRVLESVGNSESAVRCTGSQPGSLDDVLDRKLIEQCQDALEEGKPTSVELPVRNSDRTVGAMLSGEIAKRYGGKGLPDDTISCKFKGAAGQSFGAFAARGITMDLEGEANDYLGKGLSGARIIVRPPADSVFEPSENVICGNVLLYGATAGELYINGRAGERFAVRNSGCQAVVEGIGDHGCEYMTGGRVVVLGETGVNFGAGMSGGIAYVYDPDGVFDARCNLGMVDLELVVHDEDVSELKDLIERHLKYTGSEIAGQILEDWQACMPFFVKVLPMEYRRVLGQMSVADRATQREEISDG